MDKKPSLIQQALKTKNFELSDATGRNALMLAFMYGSHEEIEQLIFMIKGSGNDSAFFQQDAKGRTALFYAVERGELLLLKKLLFSLNGTGLFCQRGALMNIKDQTGISAEDLAQRLEKQTIYQLLSRESTRIEFYGQF